MRTVETTNLPSQAEARVRRLRGVAAAVVAACVTWLLIEGLGGVELQAPAFSDNASTQDIGLVGVFVVSLTASLAGWLALGLVERYTSQPRRWWIVLSVGALVLSLGGPMSGTGITDTDRILLVLLHLVTGLVLITLFYRTITNRGGAE